MIYNILFEADKHWGATKPEDQYRSSYIIKRLLEVLDVHLFVSLGDFYDTKLLLNSRASIYAIRDMHDKAEICRQKGIPMRVIRGTLSHDYDQMDAFSNIMNDPNYNFLYFNHLTVEETLPGLRIVYGPDENLNWDRWSDSYFEQLVEKPCQLMCAHGNFDVVMAKIALDTINAPDSTTLAYRYHDLMRVLKGPIIAGHFHDGNEFEHLYYVGSSDRWIFGEDHEKGFMLLQYDTEKGMYKVIRIPNFLAASYKTFMVWTHIYEATDDYQHLIDEVEKALEEAPNLHIRIKITVDVAYPDTEAQILNLKYHFSSDKRVSFTIDNTTKVQKRDEDHEEVQRMVTEYDFIRDKNISIPKKIYLWIKKTGKEYPLKQIEDIVLPELESLKS